MADQIDPSAIAKARAAGYSDTEIADHLAQSSPGIGKAREAGYSDSEIVAHLSGGSAPAPDEKPSALADVAMQLPTGFNEGLATMAGAPVDAMTWALNKIPGVHIDNAFAGSESIKRGLGYIHANPDNAPAQTQAGQFARSAGNMAAQAVLPEAAVAGAARSGIASPQLIAAAQRVVGNGADLPMTAASGAVAGAASEGAGQATEGTAAEPYARLGAAVLGGALASRLAAARNAAPLQDRPSIDDVQAEASRLYNDPAVKNLRVDPTAVNTLGDKIASSLEQRGMFREDHAPVFNAVDRLSGANGPVAYDQLDAVRKALGARAGEIDAFGRSTPTAAAANHARGLLDDFIGNDMTHPANVLQGNPVAANAAIREARANSGAAIRSEQVLNRLNNAQADADTANSGMNLQNRIRQSLKTFVKNDEAKMAGYTDAEKAQMQKLVRGSMAMNALRFAGNAMGGSGMTIGPYVLFGHPLVPAAGWGLKTAANIATKRLTQNMADTLLSRAPIVQRTIAANRIIKAANTSAGRTAATHGALRAAAASLLARTTGN